MLIVLIFKSSNALAAAYGIAVTGVMFLSTLLVATVALKLWHWKLRFVIPVFGLLALIDLAFLSSNALKIVDGGWLPLFIAGVVFIVMETWRKGRRVQLDRIRNESMPLALLLDDLHWAAKPTRSRRRWNCPKRRTRKTPGKPKRRWKK